LLLINNTLNVCFVTGTNIDKLKQLIVNIANNYKNPYSINVNNKVEFIINDMIILSDIGIIVLGRLYSGIINLNDKLYLCNDTLIPITIKSIQIYQKSRKSVYPGENCALLIDCDQKINKYSKIISI
jgi:selenocysteine-specific translation elongation factor